MLGRRAVLPIALLALTGCSTATTMCSTVGCISGATVEVPADLATTYAGATATLCLQDTCTTAPMSTAPAPLSVGLPTSGGTTQTPTTGPVPLHLTVVRDGRTLLDTTASATLQRQVPNGEACPPVCWSAAYRLTSTGLQTQPVG